MIGQINNNFSNRGLSGNRGPGVNRGPGGNQGPGGPRGPHRRPGSERALQGDSGSTSSLGGRMRSDRTRGQNPTANLTSEQRAEVQALRQEAQADGTVTGEERRAIGDTLRSYRQEANSSSSSDANAGPLGAAGPFANLDLTDSQRSEIESLATAAKSDGQFTHEDRESIHQAVESMVGHSIPRPQGPPGGPPQGGVGSSQFGGNSFADFQLGQTNSNFPGAQQFQTSMSQLQQLFQGFLGSY